MSVEQFLNQCQEISPLLPILIRTIAVSLAAILTWIVVSILAYWIAQALDPRLDSLLKATSSIRQKLYSTMQGLFGGRRSPLEHFIEHHAQIMFLGEDNTEIVREIRSVGNAALAIPRRITNLESNLSSARATTEQNILAISRIEYPKELSTPTPHEFSLVQADRNQALLRTVLFSTLCIVLIATNTLMLKEFFIALFPPMKLLGIPLAFVGAFFFSLLEFGIGASIAFIDGRTTTATLGRALLIFMIFLLGSIEFGFYARFGQGFDFNPFSFLFSQGSTWEKLSEMWFAVFGPVIVFTLAFCADLLFVGVRNLANNRVAAQWRAYLKLRVAAVDEFRKSLSTAQVTNILLKAAVDDANQAFVANSPGSIHAELDEARKRFENSLDKAKEIRLEPTKQLVHSEMVRLYGNKLFLTLAVISATSFLAFAYGPLGVRTTLFHDGYAIFPYLIAIAEAVGLIAAGYFSTYFGSQSQIGGQFSAIVRWPRWPTYILSGAIITAFILGNAFFIFQQGNLAEAMWFSFVCASCLVILRCGQNLGLMIAATWTFLQSLAILLASALAYSAWFFLGLLHVIASALRAVIRVLAFPFSIVFLWNRPESKNNLTVNP